MLHHLGWSLSSLDDPQPLAYGNSRVPRASWQMAPLPDGSFLLLVFLDELLPDLASAFKAYEDLAPLHAELRWALQEGKLLTRHVLLVDPETNVQLVDFSREDILINARGENEVVERLLPLLHLNRLAGGSLTSFPRKTLRQRARELGDWTKLWSSRIGSVSGSSPEDVAPLFHWLLLTRLAEVFELGRPGKLPLADYGLRSKPPQPVRYLIGIFRPLAESWNYLQGASLARLKEIADRAHQKEQLESCLKSFSRVSRSKFSSEVFAEAFSDEELRMRSWRHSLVEAEIPPEEEPSRWLYDPITVDLDVEGFSGLLRRFDAICEDLRQLSREQAVLRERGARPGLQMDVFGSEPPAVTEEEAPRLALQLALRVRTSTRRRAETARLVLLAHAAEWHARLRRSEPIFPSPVISTEQPQEPASAQARPAGDSNPGLN